MFRQLRDASSCVLHATETLLGPFKTLSRQKLPFACLSESNILYLMLNIISRTTSKCIRLEQLLYQ
jgi:hypothetical protein